MQKTVKWRFHRIGGLDQVTLRTAEELCHLRELDPKLWVALSCPASGLEFDARTLALIDADNDGRIRIPEIVDAVEWICRVLKDPAVLVDSPEVMPLSCIDTEDPHGARMYATGCTILENLGKQDREGLTPDDVRRALESAAEQSFNGDGILPPLPDFDEDIRIFIAHALEIIGGVEDASGKPGVNADIAKVFVQYLRDWRDWKHSLSDVCTSLGDNSAEIWSLMQELHEKIDDYFLRCELASYSPEALPSLNADEEIIASKGNGGIEAVTLDQLPLARVGVDRPLRLASGMNPAWRERMARFFSLINPRLARENTMTAEEWRELRHAFHPFDSVLASKPSAGAVEVNIKPTAVIEDLGDDKIDAILNGNAGERFARLVERDLSVPVSADDLAAVERLVLYYRHLYRLLMNFTSFYDFYSLRKEAAFLAGTLYIDGRSCRLCLPVTDVAKHSALATFSEICLLYCECRRKQRDENGVLQEEVTHIVGAMTAGDSDLLLEGRNGVFVDNMGNDWDATLVKVITKPISLKQALWEPYKRLGRMISDQIGKFAGEKQDQLGKAVGQKVTEAGSAVVAGKPPIQGQSFDIGRSVGIFAAIGLALGAIGTALASIANALFALSWWQFPLVFLGIFLLVSGPSVVLAWVKLRKRTLGPLLEASGWAVNGQVPINLGLGSALTSTAELPPNASRSYKDPFKRIARWPWIVLLTAALTGAVITGLWLSPATWNKVFSNTFLEQRESGGLAVPLFGFRSLEAAQEVGLESKKAVEEAQSAGDAGEAAADGNQSAQDGAGDATEVE